MPKMQALRFDKFGPPSVLVLAELDIPDPIPGEAVVRVLAAGINPSDVKNVAGAFDATLPRVPGRDFSGVVVAGEAWVGKEVWGNGAGFGVTRDGTHAEYLRVPITWLAEKPARLSMAQAAGVGIPFITAWRALVHAADIQAGETILITGASGAVGQAATQIAHWKQAKVIGADRSARPSEADFHVDMSRADLAAEVKRLTDGTGADVVLDTVGGALFEPSLRSLRAGGRQIVMASVGNRRVTFDLIDFYHDMHRLIGIDSIKLTGEQIAKTMNDLRPGFDAGHLRAPVTTTWPLNRVHEAYTAVAVGSAAGKHVLLPQHS